MKIGVLTSSRADYSIYLPLLKKLEEDSYFDLQIIAFGTHNSPVHGNTIDAINKDGFKNVVSVETMPTSDKPIDISKSQAKTFQAFADYYNNNQFDLIFALGDRFEMFAAVAAGLPFNVKFAHIHGGETTLGAIDNAYRHSISHMAKVHFPVCDEYKTRLVEMLGSDKNIFNVGALSIENLKNLQLLSVEELKSKFQLDFSVPTILCTFHPETVALEKNKTYTSNLLEAFRALSKYQIVVTMPNADTMGNYIRLKLEEAAKSIKHLKLIESFGTIGYLSAMKHCAFMLGNTSSGFGEASFFPTPAINLGNRQDGRMRSPHIFDTPIDKNSILESVNLVEQKRSSLKPIFPYGDGNTSTKIVEILKQINLGDL